MEIKGDESIVIACELADAPKTIRGATFDQECHVCKGRLMLSPSGQQFLKRYPQSRLICKYCYVPTTDAKFGLTGDLNTVRNELKNIVPNLWRKRN